MIETIAELSFGLEGDAATSQVRGFSYPEMGFTWTVGGVAALRVDLDGAPAPTMIELEVEPFVAGPELTGQTLTIRVNGVEIATDRIERGGTLGYWLPREIDLESGCLVEFLLPDAARPRDLSPNPDPRKLGLQLRHLRMLSVPREPSFGARSLPPPWRDQPVSLGLQPEFEEEVERRCGQSVHDLMFAFENLGWNCEFGLLQRRCGAEPLSLLRFSGITLPCLLRGLAAEFAGVDTPEQTGLELVGPEREFFFRNDTYGLRGHTWRFEGKADQAKVLRDVLRNLSFYRRKFIEDLTEGNRLYVFQSPEPVLAAHALPLLTALRRRGDCSLLFVCDTPDLPAGTVEQLSPHLFRGCLKTFAPLIDVTQSDLPSWVGICANAWRLWKGVDAGHSTPALEFVAAQ